MVMIIKRSKIRYYGVIRRWAGGEVIYMPWSNFGYLVRTAKYRAPIQVMRPHTLSWAPGFTMDLLMEETTCLMPRADRLDQKTYRNLFDDSPLVSAFLRAGLHV